MSQRTLSLHQFIRGLILMGFALYIVYLFKTDSILYYIAPRMLIYVKASAVGFYLISVYQLYSAFRTLQGHKLPCDCEHPPSSSVTKNTLVYGLFVLPLLMGFMLPDSSLGSSLADKKGMNLSSSSTVKKVADSSQSVPSVTPVPVTDRTQLDTLFPAEKYTEHYAKYAKELYKSQDPIPVKEDLFMETLTTLDLYLTPFIGKKLEISGFVYRTEEMNPAQFAIGRFAMSCCSADASPYGVLAEYPNAATYSEDTWVKVTGTIEKKPFNGTDIMALKVEKVQRIQEPTNKFVYPNYEFGL